MECVWEWEKTERLRLRERQRKSRQKKIKWRRERKLGFPCPSLLQSNHDNDAGTGNDKHMCIYNHLHIHAHNEIAPNHHLAFCKPPTAARLHHSLLSPSLWASSLTSLSLSNSFSDCPSLFFSLTLSPNLLFLPFLSLHQYIHLSFISSVFRKTASVK